MYCFSGKRDVLERALNNGYYISIATNILRSKNIKKIARDTPIDKILVETDAPYLSPTPNEINYPWNTELVIKKIAEIKKIDEKGVLEVVKRNAREIFFRINRSFSLNI